MFLIRSKTRITIGASFICRLQMLTTLTSLIFSTGQGWNEIYKTEDNQLVIFDIKIYHEDTLLGVEKTSAQHEFF